MHATLIAAALSLSTAAAAPWAVAPVEAVNVHPGHVAAAQQILTGHLEALGQPIVTLDAGVADPAAAAREKGAAAVLRCSMTRIGQRVKVWMRLQPLDGPPRTVTLDAASPEDLDPVLLRLARHLSQGSPVADAHIGEVTEREEEPFGRKTATSYFGLSVSGTFGGTRTRSAASASIGSTTPAPSSPTSRRASPSRRARRAAAGPGSRSPASTRSPTATSPRSSEA